MKKIKLIILALFLFVGVQTTSAQFKTKFLASWYKVMAVLRPTPWTVGLGWNIVEDNGNAWKKIFDVKPSWNFQYYPSSIRAEKELIEGWSAMFNFNFNQYKTGKNINGDIPAASTIFLSFDLNAKYNFSHLYDFSSKLFKLGPNLIDVYAASGFGYTYRKTARFGGTGTYNIGFGTTAIVYKSWGFNLEAMCKFGLAAPFFKTPTNYLQYSFGAVYRFKLNPQSFGKRRKIRQSLKTKL